MSQVVKCLSCNGDFDGEMKVQVILPCEHYICFTCASDQYQKSMSIKCFDQSCQLIHKTNPLNLPKDGQLLKHLEPNVILDSIALFEGYQTEIRSAYIMLSQQQASFLFQLINNLKDYVFKNSLAKQRELKQFARQLSQQLSYLKYQQVQMIKQGPVQQGIQESSIDPRMEQLVQKLAKEAQEIFQQVSYMSVNVLEERDRMRVQMDTLSQTNSSYLTQIQQLSQQVQSSQQERKQIANQLEVTNDALRKLNQVSVDNDKKIVQMGQQLQDLQREKMSLQKQVKYLANKNQTLETQLKECQGQYRQCQQQLSEAKQQNIVKPVTPQEEQKVQVKPDQQKKQQAPQSQSAKNTNKEIQITAVSPNNKSVNVTVKQDATIKELKIKIQDKTCLF